MEGITNETVNKEQQRKNFENLKYDPLENSHFYNTNIQNLNTPYILPEELQNFLGNDKDENASVLHINTRIINKDFENFKMVLSNLNFSFSIICFSETWLNDSNVDNSNYELRNYVSVHQIKNHYKGGGVSVYIFIRISNLKSEMILALIVNALIQLVWNSCMKKGGTLYSVLSIDHPNAK